MTAPHPVVTLDTLLVRSEEVLFQEVGGEAVLLDLASEQYFGLDPVGTRIWELIDGQARLREIHGTLCAEYDAEPTKIAADLLALGQSLVDAGLARAC
jgi:Coenzyme PQQ synthesis protein D (PqqD)